MDCGSDMYFRILSGIPNKMGDPKCSYEETAAMMR